MSIGKTISKYGNALASFLTSGGRARYAQDEELIASANMNRNLAGIKEEAGKATFGLQRDQAKSQSALLPQQEENTRKQLSAQSKDLDRQEEERMRLAEIRDFELETQRNKAKLAQLLGEDALQAYEAGAETRDFYLNQQAKLGSERLAIAKEGFAMMDKSSAVANFYSQIQKIPGVKMGINTAKQVAEFFGSLDPRFWTDAGVQKQALKLVEKKAKKLGKKSDALDSILSAVKMGE